MTAPRNPSELERLFQERHEILRMLRDGRTPPSSPLADKGLKATREGLLKELRSIEETLDIRSIPYNSTEFAKQYDELD